MKHQYTIAKEHWQAFSKKNIFVIIGSASINSANEKLVDNFAVLTADIFSLTKRPGSPLQNA